MYDYVIIGAGIVGLSVAYTIQKKQPDAFIAVLEKEEAAALHQTGNNSGVIHSGIYYPPKSFKAAFAKNGNRSMITFCEEHEIPYEQCGKIIVATEEKQMASLQNLYKRAQDNELTVYWLEEDQLKEREPHVKGVAGIEVPSTGIVNYKTVSDKLAVLIQEKGNHIFFNEQVISINENDEVSIKTRKQTINGKKMVNCAGLHSDRIAKLAGYHMDMQIVPFRGEYYQLKEEARHLVKHLIYPVPNPDFPFLGVHFTRMIDGGVEAGPNAVLGLKREGYSKMDWNVKDLTQVLVFPGFWKLASSYIREGTAEMVRSVSKKSFIKSLQKLIPEITENDIEKAPAGVRAQALRLNGKLVDDFYIVKGKHSLHVCNAPSPAATGSLQIGEEVFQRFQES
ncbi:L-2-hydroxyglutarate oxidase [Salibacterium aidingense]|uniref:L-2-hydroxyglutarate oxidase n=1 Tax=Salibacterium aidingense TaxID=384933 RepID=UPI0004220ED0|nr:L-2-hydroxyglutarate oxidase [Salibacterium aidingense]